LPRFTTEAVDYGPNRVCGDPHRAARQGPCAVVAHPARRYIRDFGLNTSMLDDELWKMDRVRTIRPTQRVSVIARHGKVRPTWFFARHCFEVVGTVDVAPATADMPVNQKVEYGDKPVMFGRRRRKRDCVTADEFVFFFFVRNEGAELRRR
jgi:hypothetical protein